MRFIGGKSALLESIERVINENVSGGERVFCDIFAGTGTVSKYFKPKYEIISNDLLHFSYVIQKATVENNKKPQFKKLIEAGIPDPFAFLEETRIDTYDYNDAKYFVTKNYSPHNGCERMYVTNKNAVRIDFIRNMLESWNKENLLSEAEYYYLLAGLIEGVPFVSNITGTYGAYLKSWDKRALDQFEMLRLEVLDNQRENRSYNQDANKLICEIEGDILYLDPPYNSRQYAPNYHLLETISRYDYPKISGVTGMRPYSDEKSRFCVKKDVVDAFEDLIDKAKFSNIVLSYSTDGLMRIEQIESILKKHCVADSYKMYTVPYRKYKSKLESDKKELSELLFFVKKEISKPLYFDLTEQNLIVSEYKTHTMKKYIKSPLNYIGGKYKLLPQILPHFPRNIGTFADLFSGGANVAVNVSAKRIICNDINTKIIEMFRTFQSTKLDELLRKIENNIEKYQLSKENEQGFNLFREHYNKTKDPIDLYTLVCYSFNYQFRFNNSLEYNNPFGRNRSRFSESMRNNLIVFVEKIQSLNIEFTSSDFENFDINKLTARDMIYCDPPYFITTGSYNDGNRGFKDWKITQEEALYNFLDKADERGIRFALSNVLTHKGRTNELLCEWSEKYKVITLSSDYSNSSYNTKRGASTEVLIINY